MYYLIRNLLISEIFDPRLSYNLCLSGLKIALIRVLASQLEGANIDFTRVSALINLHFRAHAVDVAFQVVVEALSNFALEPWLIGYAVHTVAKLEGSLLGIIYTRRCCIPRTGFK